MGLLAGWKAHAATAAAAEDFGAAAAVRLCPAKACTTTSSSSSSSSSREMPEGNLQIFKPPQVQGKTAAAGTVLLLLLQVHLLQLLR